MLAREAGRSTRARAQGRLEEWMLARRRAPVADGELAGASTLDGQPVHGPQPVAQVLAERYAELAGSRQAHRAVDLVLRALDVILAVAALVVLAPLMAAIALAIVLTSGRPVLYRGQRVGRAGSTFTMYKFRTLRPDAEARIGPFLGQELTKLTELETTRLGAQLRRLHLDELPQLYNVVRGDMSLVGPRPIRPAFYLSLCEAIPQYWQRLLVRPGMTGFAQLRMTREMSWEEKLAHDLEYVADRSVRLYLELVAATGSRLLVRRDSAVGPAHTGL